MIRSQYLYCKMEVVQRVVYIQRIWRGHSCRMNMWNQMYQAAITKINAVARGFLERSRLMRCFESVELVQMSVRAFLERRAEVTIFDANYEFYTHRSTVTYLRELFASDRQPVMRRARRATRQEVVKAHGDALACLRGVYEDAMHAASQQHCERMLFAGGGDSNNQSEMI